MTKYGRTFKITVQEDGGVFAEIKMPMTVTFEIQRDTLASANRGHFQIYNLSEGTRRKIFKDRYDTLRRRSMEFMAGYVDFSPLPVAFLGDILSAYSFRQGTEWITDIEAFDGGFGIMNGQVNKTLPAGTSTREILRSLMMTMPGVAPGSIGDVSTESARGLVLMGNSWDIAARIADGSGASAFIDNGRANVLKRDEYLGGAEGLTKVTSQTGLLNTPRAYDARIDVEILFEPRVSVGQVIELESLETVYNGLWQVIGIKHRGTISGAVGGRVSTILTLWKGTERLKAAA